jgi:hypothetical protein
MAEKLTKTAIKEELSRRIEWFETAYGFNNETRAAEVSIVLREHLGRYRALRDALYQVENNMFIGGFAC